MAVEASHPFDFYSKSIPFNLPKFTMQFRYPQDHSSLAEAKPPLKMFDFNHI